MYRQGKLSNWKRHKTPKQGPLQSKPTYCLTNHYHRSGLEGKVCDELRLRKIAGDIIDYVVEKNYELESYGMPLGISYRADFVTEEKDGTTEIIDAKGIFFPLFKLKWRLMQAMFKSNPTVKFRVVTR